MSGSPRASLPPEVESFLGTVPGMIYRTKLVPPVDIDFVNEAMSEVTGYPASDFLGPNPKRRLRDIVHPDDAERGAALIMGAPDDGRIVEIEYRIRRADGSQRWVPSRARKVFAPDGTPYLHGAAIDVTARHEAEELRRRLEAESARAAEIEASRARIVEAADEARRRLERDLHDGAQQCLVVALLTLKRASDRARGTPAEPLLEETLGHLERGLAQLRELAHGLHPSVLSGRGLAAALQTLADRSPVPVELRAASTRADLAVETAIYFTVAEALTNVAKYAQATRAFVDVALEDGTLVAEIRDDAVGGANPSSGSGLRGLVDRLEALGGTLEIVSPAGGGTIIRARAPVERGA
jgi:PAS domain S-box-containing protein